MVVSTFGIEKEFLRKLLEQASEGTLQLPEFQRGWVWPMENIRSLLASISLGYPVGTLMMLRNGGEVRFKQRPLEGTDGPRSAARLLLDGQQRLTSLYQALLLDRAIETQDVRKRKISGWFYVDISKALDENLDREEAFLFVPADRMTRNFRGEVEVDLTTPANEYVHGLFPMARVFDYDDWLDEFDDHWDDSDRRKEMRDVRKSFRQDFLQQFESYLLPVIELDQSTPRQAVCQVFEKVNTGGVTLTVFELLTATYAASEFDLRRDWEQRKSAWAGPEYKILHEVSNTDFLQAVTLLATFHVRERAIASGMDDDKAARVGCRRVDILNLPLDTYEQHAPHVVEGLMAAARLMHQLYVYDVKFLPYGSQLIPLSAVLAILGDEASSAGAQTKITEWLWCGIFGELYGGTTETRFGWDVHEVVAWVRGSSTVPRTVQEARFLPGRLDTLRTRNSAAYKGIYALLMRQGARDWITGETMSVTTYFDQQVDVHHIFPRAWCEKNGITPHRFNSIINKTPITARTNRVIGGQSPSRYLGQVVKKAGTSEQGVHAHITTHLVDTDLLQSDAFDAFCDERRRSLLAIIGNAMGKVIEADSAVPEEFAPEPEDELE